MVMGRLLVATDVRLRRAADGSVLTTHPAAVFSSFEPFTDVYRTVTLLARQAREDHPTVGVANGPNVDFAAVPDFTSMRALASGLPALISTTWREVGLHDVIFGRLPEPLSLLVGCMALMRGKPFIANVVADPSHPRLGAGWRARSVDRLVLFTSRLLVKKAAATIFVTRSYLQRICPPGPDPPSSAATCASARTGSAHLVRDFSGTGPASSWWGAHRVGTRVSWSCWMRQASSLVKASPST